MPTLTETRPAREAFDWLDDPRGRRAALRSVAAAIRLGWLPAPENRAALIAKLTEIASDPAAPERHQVAACRAVAAMAARNSKGAAR